MRLHDFIEANMEPILQAWEGFARSIWPGDAASTRVVRDHAAEMLREVVKDMQTRQSDPQQNEKSMGRGANSIGSDSVDQSSARHAISRVESGFDLRSLVAEYRALRASVLHLWSMQEGPAEREDLSDMTRFNEAVDQLLAESIVTYSERVEHSREIFLGILGHDLRTPLHAVAMVADLLERHGELSGLALNMASRIAGSVREMERMVTDLLDFTGTRLGAKMTVSPLRMDLDQLCREVVGELRIVHPARVFNYQEQGPVTGEWDRSRLRQLISNLLGNAIQHGSTTTPVVLFLSREGEQVLVGVRNQGTPIPRDSLTLIFDPLRRSSTNQLSRPVGSIGLGLYIAREVASAHAGTIHVTSDPEETVFLVRLPSRGEAVAKVD